LQKLFALILRTLFPYNILLFTPAARGSFAASDEVKAYMFFSPALFAERQSQGVPRGNAWACFLGSFFATRQRMNIKTQTDQREPKARSMIVKRSSCKNPNKKTVPYRHQTTRNGFFFSSSVTYT
jgi:hypothetical protein